MPTDEEEIRQLVKTWMAATKAGDIETVLSLMAEDVIFLLPGQEPTMGKSAFASAARAQATQGPMQFDGTSEIQEIKVLGDWAFVGQVDGRRNAARRSCADDARRPRAVDLEKAKRQMGACA